MPKPAVVRPTYDHVHYLARAAEYARTAEHEPDPRIKAVLRGLAQSCREKAAGCSDKAVLDC
jgi:hypothetical protein